MFCFRGIFRLIFEYNLFHWYTFFAGPNQIFRSASGDLEHFLNLILNCFDKSIEESFSSNYTRLDADYDTDMNTILQISHTKLDEVLEKMEKTNVGAGCIDKFTRSLLLSHEVEFNFLWTSRLANISFACENIDTCSTHVNDETKKFVFRILKNIVSKIPIDNGTPVVCKQAMKKIANNNFSRYSFDEQEENFRIVKKQCLSKVFKTYELCITNTNEVDCIRGHGMLCLGNCFLRYYGKRIIVINKMQIFLQKFLQIN